MDKITALKYITTKHQFSKNEIDSDIIESLILSGLVDKYYTLTKDQYLYNLTEKGTALMRQIMFEESMTGYALNRIKSDFGLDIDNRYINKILTEYHNENKSI